jgi:hypothetical protein
MLDSNGSAPSYDDALRRSFEDALQSNVVSSGKLNASLTNLQRFSKVTLEDVSYTSR